MHTMLFAVFRCKPTATSIFIRVIPLKIYKKKKNNTRNLLNHAQNHTYTDRVNNWISHKMTMKNNNNNNSTNNDRQYNIQFIKLPNCWKKWKKKHAHKIVGYRHYEKLHNQNWYLLYLCYSFLYYFFFARFSTHFATPN